MARQLVTAWARHNCSTVLESDSHVQHTRAIPFNPKAGLPPEGLGQIQAQEWWRTPMPPQPVHNTNARDILLHIGTECSFALQLKESSPKISHITSVYAHASKAYTPVGLTLDNPSIIFSPGWKTKNWISPMNLISGRRDRLLVALGLQHYSPTAQTSNWACSGFKKNWHLPYDLPDVLVFCDY